MLEVLKKLKGVLAVNKRLSDICSDKLQVIDDRAVTLDNKLILEPSAQFNVNLSNYKTELSAYWQSFIDFKSEPKFIVSIENGTVVSKGIVVDARNFVHLESTIFQREYLNALYSNHLILGKILLPNLKLKLVVPLLNRLDNNYFHWTLETLTRVMIFKDHPDFKNVKWIIKSSPLPFVKESLNFLFDIPNKNIFEKKLFSKINFQKGYVISFPHIRNQTSQNTNVYYPDVIRSLNRLVLDKVVNQNREAFKWPERIIISRSKATVRRLVNEKQLQTMLESKGFMAIALESLSYKEQVSLFSNVKIVIGMHGAGLTNLIYAKKVKVIELFPSNRKIRDAYYFAQISAALGFEHYLLEIKPVNKKQDCMLSETQIEQIIGIVNQE